MDSPIIHGDPFTPDRLRELMAELSANFDADSKISPHTRFMDHAKAAGFSDSQAEFLWQLHLMPPPRLF